MSAASPSDDGPAVRLEVAARDDQALIAELIELYARELSVVFDLKPGPDGRFGYAKLPLYWSAPTRRFPFLIRHGAAIAGFALATRGSPASSDPETLDIAEFFVMRDHRRGGVGRRAAFLLWDRMPGRWTVRVSLGNEAALRFWAATVAAYTGGGATMSTLPGGRHAWQVFTFG